MVAYFNGQFVPKEDIRISPDDRGFLFGDGLYDATASYGGKFLALDRHLARLEHGLEEVGITGIDVQTLAPVHYELLRRNGLEDTWTLVYVQVTRGVAPRGHAFPVPSVPPTVYAYASAVVARYDPVKGVKAITTPDIRWSRCDLKTVNLMPNCWAKTQARDAGAFEAIFIRDGVAVEGTHTSLFAVIDGVVCTGPKSNYLLPSVTRELVLDLCRRNNIPSCETPIHLAYLRRAEEVFLAGTTSEVLPVVDLDGVPVGGASIGPTTRRIQDLFRELTRTGTS